MQAIHHAAGKGGVCGKGAGACSRAQKQNALESILSDSGPAAEQREAILACLNIDSDYFREGALRAIAKAAH